ncbi:MAG: DNA repair protein RecO [Leptospiraceae bacterium]|nr:DNA repair protein RecO [Leptospiraceae bacterium]
MSLDKANGIVLETKGVGEADSLITVLLENGLKENFILKGIRKTKKREVLANEIACLINLVYYHKKNKEVFSVKEIHLLERFTKLKSSYLGFVTLSAIVEIVNKFLPKNLEQKKVFEYLLRALEVLEELGVSNITLPFFKLKLLQILGYVPKEFECMTCSKNILQTKEVYLNSSSFEIQCSECGSLPENHLEVLLLMRKMSFTSYRSLLKESIPEENLKKLDFILNRFIQSLLGYELKAQSFIGKGENFSF